MVRSGTHEPVARRRHRHHLPAGRRRPRPGTKFEVECRGERLPAEVVKLPFWTKGSVEDGEAAPASEQRRLPSARTCASPSSPSPTPATAASGPTPRATPSPRGPRSAATPWRRAPSSPTTPAASRRRSPPGPTPTRADLILTTGGTGLTAARRHPRGHPRRARQGGARHRRGAPDGGLPALPPRRALARHWPASAAARSSSTSPAAPAACATGSRCWTPWSSTPWTSCAASGPITSEAART